jgi:hypothetical protein
MNKKEVVYYESRKRELKIRLMNEGRCDERLKLELRNLHDSHTLGCTTSEVSGTTIVHTPDGHPPTHPTRKPPANQPRLHP